MKRRIIGLLFVLAIFAMATDTAQAWGRRGCRRCHRTVVVCQPVGCFEFQKPCDFTATPEGITPQTDVSKFAIKLIGNPAKIATFVNETVKFTANCKVVVPPQYYGALRQAGHPADYLKTIQVPLEAPLNEKGVAEFNKQDLYTAVQKELARIKFWETPALYGIEKFKIKTTGVARVGSYIFRNANVCVLKGNVK